MGRSLHHANLAHRLEEHGERIKEAVYNGSGLARRERMKKWRRKTVKKVPIIF